MFSPSRTSAWLFILRYWNARFIISCIDCQLRHFSPNCSISETDHFASVNECFDLLFTSCFKSVELKLQSKAPQNLGYWHDIDHLPLYSPHFFSYRVAQSTSGLINNIKEPLSGIIISIVFSSLAQTNDRICNDKQNDMQIKDNDPLIQGQGINYTDFHHSLVQTLIIELIHQRVEHDTDWLNYTCLIYGLECSRTCLLCTTAAQFSPLLQKNKVSILCDAFFELGKVIIQLMEEQIPDINLNESKSRLSPNILNSARSFFSLHWYKSPKVLFLLRLCVNSECSETTKHKKPSKLGLRKDKVILERNNSQSHTENNQMLDALFKALLNRVKYGGTIGRLRIRYLDFLVKFFLAASCEFQKIISL